MAERIESFAQRLEPMAPQQFFEAFHDARRLRETFPIGREDFDLGRDPGTDSTSRPKPRKHA